MCRTAFEPLAISTRHVSNTNRYRHPLGADEEAFCASLLAEIEDMIAFEGAETIRDAHRRARAERRRVPDPTARLLARAP